MSLGDRSAHGEAHARAIFLGREKRLENALRLFQAWPDITDLDSDAAVSVKESMEPYQPRTVDNRVQGIDRIADQVDEDLLHLGPIDEHWWQVSVEIGFHLDILH